MKLTVNLILIKAGRLDHRAGLGVDQSRMASDDDGQTQWASTACRLNIVLFVQHFCT